MGRFGHRLTCRDGCTCVDTVPVDRTLLRALRSWTRLEVAARLPGSLVDGLRQLPDPDEVD